MKNTASAAQLPNRAVCANNILTRWSLIVMATDGNTDQVSFTKEFAAKYFQKHFSDSTTKLLSKELSAQMCAELMRVFVTEAVLRAAQQAANEDAVVCEVEHVEKILPQLLLDF